MNISNNYFIHNAFVVNEEKIFRADVLVQQGKIARISATLLFKMQKSYKKQKKSIFCTILVCFNKKILLK